MQNCTSLKTLSNWVEDKSELKDEVLVHTSQSSSKAQLANLKQAWRESVGIVERRLKRISEGANEDYADEPLDSEVQKSMEGIFRTTYQWTLRPRWFGHDGLLGRTRREFERNQPSLYVVLKVRSIAASRTSRPNKRHKLNNEVEFTVNDTDPSAVDAPIASPSGQYLECLTIFANTWALAGCYKVFYEGKEVLYCHWQLSQEYVIEFRDKANAKAERFEDSSIAEWLIKTEEKFRAEAIGFARDADPMPWGLALTKAVKDNAYIWNEFADVLVPKKSGGGVPPGKTRTVLPVDEALGARLSKNSLPAGFMNAMPNQHQRKATATATASGRKICKAYNDQRGCANKRCPKGLAHVCDVLLANGRVCESTEHVRSQHDAGRHGQPQYLQ